MKINKNDLASLRSLLNSIPYERIEGSKCAIVFPIDDQTVVESDGIEMVTKSEFRNNERIIPALTLNDNLVYINPTYAKKFDVLGYCSLLKKHLSSKAEKMLMDYDCYLIETDYILIGFNF